MRYLKPFNESFFKSRVPQISEILNSIVDLSLDFKDEGFNLFFGVINQQMSKLHTPLPSGMPSFYNQLTEAHIRNVLILNCKICVLFDFKRSPRPNHQFLLNGLNDVQKEIVCNTLQTVDDFLKSESDLITNIDYYYTMLGEYQGGYRAEGCYKSSLEDSLSRIKSGQSVKNYLTFKIKDL